MEAASMWAKLSSSRKSVLAAVAVAMVLVLVTGAEVVFVVLTLRGRMTVAEFQTATLVSLPTAVVGLIAPIMTAIHGIAREDAATKSASSSSGDDGATKKE